ncbi:MAG: glycoside hydrolase family 5 protein [Bacteroidales bacterium]|nr:glycoside hydrolase family 5 protein [Bacteroidales bacterium]
MKKAIILCIFAALAFGCRPMDAPAPPQEKPQDKQDKPDEPDKPDTPDVTDTFESAAEAVINMGAGWNLGNTLDSNSGDTGNMWIEAWTARTPKDYETAWGQPVTTRELIHMFKEAGFGVIRVPVTWYPHMGTITLYDQNKWNPATWTGTTVDPVWMARVKEVVDYVIDEGMYCILNVHHDTGDASTAWIRASEAGFNAAKDRYEVLWQQIAITFKDYDEKLLFESYNEMLDQYDSWCFASFAAPGNYDADVAKGAYNAIYKYARLFTETVRATGGNNLYRNLVVNTYCAGSGDGTWSAHLQDPIASMQIPEEPGHIAIEVHSYWEAPKFAEQKTDIDRLFTNLDTYIVKRLGVPVIIGEWGGGSNDDNDANVTFAGYFSGKAKEAGIAACWWMGLSDAADRSVPAWTMPRTKDAILQQVNKKSSHPHR